MISIGARVVLDTGVFFVPSALERLSSVPHDVVVPAVVLTERARQLAKHGVDPAELLEALEANAFDVEAYGVDEALAWAPGIHADDDWQRLARDAMIAGHVDEGDVLWTTNPADFVEIGVDADRIATVDAGG